MLIVFWFSEGAHCQRIYIYKLVITSKTECLTHNLITAMHIDFYPDARPHFSGIRLRQETVCAPLSSILDFTAQGPNSATQ